MNALEGEANFWTGNKTLDTSQGVGLRGGDPVAMQKAGFGKVGIKGKYVGKYEGVKVYENGRIGLGVGEASGGLTLPPDKILVGKGAYSLLGKGNKKVADLFRHEFGHILQSRQPFVGLDGFYKVIAPASIKSAATSTYVEHNAFWTETWANHLSNEYFGGTFNAISAYPTSPLSLNNFLKFF